MVLLELPFSDGTARKKRPAVVISNATLLNRTVDLVVCAITSAPAAADLPGTTSLGYWRDAGLVKPSLVKLSIHTVDRAVVARRLGRLHVDDMGKVDEALRTMLF